MAVKEYPLEPLDVPKINTRHRCIQTQIPVQESLSLLRQMREAEPRSMRGQPPVLWDRGEGFYIHDPYGNKWIDFSSGVLVTACGHGHPRIRAAMEAMLNKGIYHAYCFPTAVRATLAAKIVSLAPAPLRKVFLLTTGSEATECCIKLARTHGTRAGGSRKSVFVSFCNGFHGRTMGAQLAGGSLGLKEWIGEGNYGFVQVPYPDDFREKDLSFGGVERSLAAQGISAEDVCGVMVETYQGCNAKLLPVSYAQALRAWCDTHRALLIFDEIQAGFGRTGEWFGFQHYGIVPDLAAFGKGISGGMPLSAVIGREDVMDIYGPGEMSSTHTANPLCCAAALANIEVIEQDKLVENAATLQPVLLQAIADIQHASGGSIGRADGVGLVAALQFTRPGTTEPDPDSAFRVFMKAIQSGVMLFAPVGVGGCAIKINPPLLITEEALKEGLSVILEAVRG
jgi:4-aminobutyrate aminotransferase / (S)-3-amino-2-methylpropionate transaminase / 5-aminovalerate transaminase